MRFPDRLRLFKKPRQAAMYMEIIDPDSGKVVCELADTFLASMQARGDHVILSLSIKQVGLFVAHDADQLEALIGSLTQALACLRDQRAVPELFSDAVLKSCKPSDLQN